MRELERFVILQVVDARWREHLEKMDYMREGIHLRSFAQKDPLVEYRGEGHKMFEQLGHEIREEVVFTLFHAEIEPADAAMLEQQQRSQNGNLQYAHDTSLGADAIAGAAVGSTAAMPAIGGRGSAPPGGPPTGVAPPDA